MTKTLIHGSAARYYVIMHGTTGDFMTDYKSKKKAEQAAEKIKKDGRKMYIVKVWYNDDLTVYSFRSKKQAYQKFYGWYNHGLDMYGQVKSKIEIWHNDICIDADIY